MRHDVKEIWGAGQQQVRNIWSNIGCWHLNQWMYTLVELCSWDVTKPNLTDRSHRPWDNPDRRPSHADRRSTITREMLGKQFLATLPSTPNLRKFKSLILDVINLCVGPKRFAQLILVFSAGLPQCNSTSPPAPASLVPRRM